MFDLSLVFLTRNFSFLSVFQLKFTHNKSNVNVVTHSKLSSQVFQDGVLDTNRLAFEVELL